MKFELFADLQTGLFYPISIEDREGYVVYPVRRTPIEKELFVSEFVPTAHINSGFKIGVFSTRPELKVEEDLLGYLFYSKMPLMTYGTGIMSYSAAWQRTNANHKIACDQVSTLYRNEHFYMYEMPTIATLVTGSEVDDHLSTYLTMI